MQYAAYFKTWLSETELFSLGVYILPESSTAACINLRFSPVAATESNPDSTL